MKHLLLQDVSFCPFVIKKIKLEEYLQCHSILLSQAMVKFIRYLIEVHGDHKANSQIKCSLFVYGADFHITISSVHLSQLKKCMFISNCHRPLLKCNNVMHKEHDGLLPFFYGNRALRYVYDGMLAR